MDLNARIDEAMNHYQQKQEEYQQRKKGVAQRLEQQLREALCQALGPDLFAQFEWSFTQEGNADAGLPTGPKLFTRYRECTWYFARTAVCAWKMHQQKPEMPEVLGGFVSAQALADTFLVDLGRWRERHP